MNRRSEVSGNPLPPHAKKFESLGQMLLSAVELAPRRGIIFVDQHGNEQRTSYAELASQARRCAAGLARQDVHRGDKVLLLPHNDRPSVVALWGCLLGGLVPVPLPGAALLDATANDDKSALEIQRLARVWQQLDYPPIVATGKVQQLRDVLTDMAGTVSKKILTTEQLLETPHEADPLPGAIDDTALLLYSSGSTSQPKGVVLTHRHLLADLASTRAANRFGADDTTLCWAPLYHVIGLTCFHLLAIHNQADQVMMDPRVLVKRPEMWLDKINKHRVAFTGGPNFAFAVATARIPDDRFAGWDLSCLKVLLNGGEVVSVPTLRRFLDRFSACGLRSQAMAPAYGMSEAAGGIAYPSPDEPFRWFQVDRRELVEQQRVRLRESASRDTVAFGNLGRPLPGIELRIVDSDDRVLPQGAVGSVQIRGEAVTAEYYDDEQATRHAFCNGWLRTGDLGFLYDDELAIVGRDNDVIIVHGHNYFAHDLEQIVVQAEPTLNGKVFATSRFDEELGRESVVIFLADELCTNATARHVQQAVRRAAGLAVDHVVRIADEKLPRTPTGKIHRQKLKQFPVTGRLVALHDNEPDATEARTNGAVDASISIAGPCHVEAHLADMLAAALGVNPTAIDVETRFVEFGLGSVESLMLVRDLEEQLEQSLSVTLLFDFPTIANLAAHFVATLELDQVARWLK